MIFESSSVVLSSRTTSESCEELESIHIIDKVKGLVLRYEGKDRELACGNCLKGVYGADYL
jgi:hypothetical protein